MSFQASQLQVTKLKFHDEVAQPANAFCHIVSYANANALLPHVASIGLICYRALPERCIFKVSSMSWLGLLVANLLCPSRSKQLFCSSSKTAQVPTQDDDWDIISECPDANSKSDCKPIEKRGIATDPRSSPTCWPCYGEHKPKQCANQHAKWSKCTRCGLRLSYQRATEPKCEENFAQISNALARLQSQCRAADVSAQMIQDMIAQMAKETATKPQTSSVAKERNRQSSGNAALRCMQYGQSSSSSGALDLY